MKKAGKSVSGMLVRELTNPQEKSPRGSLEQQLTPAVQGIVWEGFAPLRFLGQIHQELVNDFEKKSK